VDLRIYDPTGRLIRTLIEGELLPAGPNAVSWDGRDSESRDVASGVFVYSLEVGGLRDVRCMAIIR
jgi:flagellar hook assembly protein FlgD